MLQMSDILALAAIMISALSIWFSLRTHIESSASQTVWSQYEHFAKILQAHIDHSQLGHLFTVPASYEMVLKQVTDSIKDLSPQEKMRLQLQERSMADYIFNEFEQSFYQISRVRPRFDSRSRKFYGEVLNYFTNTLLRNPRLLYYWSQDGGQLCFNYEPSTIEFYEAAVLNNPSLPLKFAPDAMGPFTNLEAKQSFIRRKSQKTSIPSSDQSIRSRRSSKMNSENHSSEKKKRRA